MDDLLRQIHQELGITTKHLENNKLSYQAQPSMEELEVVDIDFEGKPFVLVSSSANAWRRMKAEAAREHVFLKPFSGFRSYLHQKRLIENHLKNARF